MVVTNDLQTDTQTRQHTYASSHSQTMCPTGSKQDTRVIREANQGQIYF